MEHRTLAERNADLWNETTEKRLANVTPKVAKVAPHREENFFVDYTRAPRRSYDRRYEGFRRG